MTRQLLRRRVGVSYPIATALGPRVLGGLAVAVIALAIATGRSHCRVPDYTTCEGNEKQLGTALSLYTQDYDENLPLCNWVTSDHSTEWQNSLMAYYRSELLLRCPKDPTPYIDTSDPSNAFIGSRSVSSYLYNAYLGIRPIGDRRLRQTTPSGSRSMASVEEPGRTMAFAEGHTRVGDGGITAANGRDYKGRISPWCAQYVFPAPGSSDAGELDGGPASNGADCGLPRRHVNEVGAGLGGCVLFADLHVKFVRYQDAASVQAVLPFYPSVTGIAPEHATTRPPQGWGHRETSPGCR